MGQKTNPTVLRLEKTNQHFKACWYSQYYYSDQLHNNFKIRDYIGKIFQKINRCQPLIYIKNCHQSNQILCLFLKKRVRRYRRFKSATKSRVHILATKKWSTFCGAALKKTSQDISKTTHPETISPQTLIRDFSTQLSHRTLGAYDHTGLQPLRRGGLDDHNISHKKWQSHGMTDMKSTFSGANPGQDPTHRLKLSTLLCGAFHKQSSLLQQTKKGRPFQVSKIKHKARIENTINYSNFSLTAETFYLRTPVPDAAQSGWPTIPNSHAHSQGNAPSKVLTVESTSCKTKAAPLACQISQKKTRLYPIKVSKVTQNCDFIAEKIIGDLKRRVPYNRLRRQILRDVCKNKCVKGIRVTLSGRVKSQSKKAQKARTNTFHWGQTELHVFSSLVQFTSVYCITPFGKIGIKVWVCYHS